MFFAISFFKFLRTLLVGLSSLILIVPGAYAGAPVPAQTPLLNITGGGVAPNFMLTLDDSGSMHFRHLPEDLFAGGTFATTNPVGSNTVRWDPSDDYRVGVNFLGTVSGEINSTNYVLRALRSPDTNTLFYNPDTLYRPWLTSDGVTRLPNSPVAAAYKDPLIRTGLAATVVNLTAYGAPSGSSNWCNFNTNDPVPAGQFVVGMNYKIYVHGTTSFTAIGAGNNNVGTNFIATGVGTGTGSATLRNACDNIANNTASLNHDPGVYFRLQKQLINAGSFLIGTQYTITTVNDTDFTLIGATSNTVGVQFTATGVGGGTGIAQTYKPVTNYLNYTAYSINTVSGTYPKVAARTDCSGTVGATGCSQAQERQNFANWFTYYRTRNLMARGAMMEAFANVGNTIRVGFGRINKGTGTVDGVSTKVIEDSATYGGGGVRDFTQTRKNQLFKWLEDLPANGGTPLPAALDTVGQYYMRTDAQGPYTDDPSVSTNTVADNKTCRRSYQLMVTDGYWNGTPPTIGDQDSSAGSAISGGSYTFPANTRPYTDGYSNTLADVAMKYWKNDLQPGMVNKVVANSIDPSYWQSMTNFMVGLGVRGNLDPATDLPALTAGTKSWGQPSTSAALPANIDDLWHAALNSRGAYYSAKDPASLAVAITGALAGAQGGSGATAGVATVSSVLENGNRKYVPTYNGNIWSGDISAQPLDANGQSTTAVWSASARLPAWGSRKIFTWDTAPLVSPSTPGAVTFTWASLSTANKAAMTSGSSNLVNFLRGDHSNEVTAALPANPFRERKNATGTPFVLGDFVNSNPVLIKGLFDGGYSGLNLGGTNAYQIFTAAKTARDAVLFVGGNDGMLHGFKDVNAQPPLPSTALTDGQEVFAYVPNTVYSDLYKLGDKAYGTSSVPHKLFVDGPQREFDAYVAGPAYPAFSGQAACGAGATCWRNYLVGSLGAGGRAVYALDVTSSPNLGASNIRWEISSAADPDLGYVLAPIEVGVLPSGKWVAIFGNGFSSTNEYATLFVVDLETAAITKLNVDTTGNNGLGGVGVIRNSFGQITTLYAGDLKGKLWKFDYNSPSVPFVVSGGSTAFFTATGPSPGSLAQAITQPPSIFDHSLGGKIIVFGTGTLFTVADRVNTDTQTIYGVWDKPADTILRPLSRASMAARTLSTQSGTGLAAATIFYNLAGTSVNWGTQRGWYIDLSPAITGGRVIYPSQKVSSALALVTAVAPPQSAAVCDVSTGIGIDFIFEIEPGATSTSPLFDTNGDGIVNPSDSLVAGVQTSSVGIRALVRGVGGGTICSPGFMPVSAQNATGQTMVCVPVPPVPPVVGGSSTRILKRIERRIINPPIR
jgi:type IV pilus assembly protein PilY1